VKGHYYLGQAYEAVGRNDDALEQYERFLHLWAEADADLAVVSDARLRRDRLRNGS
jgi:hypothetical protein